MEAWADILAENVNKWTNERNGLLLERRAKERLLLIAQAGTLKAGKYSSGKRDPNAEGKADLVARLTQIEYALETLDGMLAAAAEDSPEPTE